MRPSFDVVILVEHKEKELNTLHQMNAQINDHGWRFWRNTETVYRRWICNCGYRTEGKYCTEEDFDPEPSLCPKAEVKLGIYKNWKIQLNKSAQQLYAQASKMTNNK